MEFAVMIMVLFQTADGFVVYGKYGQNFEKTTYVVRDNVSWKEAAGLCKEGTNGNGRLLTRQSPELMTEILLHHRYIIQQNGWPKNDHLWTSFVSAENGSWKKSLKDGTCEQLSSTFDGYFPQPKVGYAQCALLNMTGTDFADLWILRPCHEPHGYLCRPDNVVGDGSVEISIFDSSAIKLDNSTDVPAITTLGNVDLELCKRKLKSSRPIFAVVYSTSRSICTLYSSQTFRYPVQLDIVANQSLITIVKTSGQNVVILESQNTTVDNSSFADCYNESGESFEVTPVQSTSFGAFLSTITNPQEGFDLSLSPKEVTGTSLQPNDVTDKSSQINDGTGTSHQPNDVTDTSLHSNEVTDKSSQINEGTGTSHQPNDVTGTSLQSNEVTNTSRQPNDITGSTDAQTYCAQSCKEQCEQNNQTIPGGSFRLASLKLDRKLLSSYKRRHFSASDDRLSSFVIGLSGASVLVMAVLMIVVPDIANLVRYLKRQ